LVDFFPSGGSGAHATTTTTHAGIGFRGEDAQRQPLWVIVPSGFHRLHNDTCDDDYSMTTTRRRRQSSPAVRHGSGEQNGLSTSQNLLYLSRLLGSKFICVEGLA